MFIEVKRAVCSPRHFPGTELTYSYVERFSSLQMKKIDHTSTHTPHTRSSNNPTSHAITTIKMASKWHQKKAKLAAEQFERELQSLGNNSDDVKDQTSAVAMGGGEEAFYEKKLSKEEKKALAAKKRAEKKAKKGGGEKEEEKEEDVVEKALANALAKNDGEEIETNAAAEELAAEGTICTFSTSRKGVDARSRDVNVQNFTLQHKGNVMLDGTSVVLNHGNRYGLIGRNGEIVVDETTFVLVWIGCLLVVSLLLLNVYILCQSAHIT